MAFEILGDIGTFATGSDIREIARLRRLYIGRKEFKIKRFV